LKEIGVACAGDGKGWEGDREGGQEREKEDMGVKEGRVVVD